jgi:CHAT domain-containing protein/tetratricopeptide (TPR) repeat protein
MLNKTSLFKGLTIASLSLVTVVIPLQLPLALAQTNPAPIDARTAELNQLFWKGQSLQRQRQVEAALATFQQALSLARRYSNRFIEEITLDAIGAVYNSIGKSEKALEYHNLALTIQRESGKRPREATTLTNIGMVYYTIGKPEKALEYYNLALMIHGELENYFGEAIILTNIGAVYQRIGQPEKALEYYSLALPMFKEIGKGSREGTILNNIGTVYYDIRQPEKALEYYNLALTIHRKFGKRSGEAATLNNIGRVYRDIGQPEKALEYYSLALPIRREVKDRSGEAATLNDIGAVYHDIGQPEKALEYYSLALPIHREFKNRSGEANILWNLAALFQRQGKLDAALQNIDLAINILETTRSEIKSNELRTTYLASVQAYYKLRVDLLMQLHQKDPTKRYDFHALQASEQARARGLNDLLNEAHIDIRQGVDPALLAKEQELTAQLRALETRRTELAGERAPNNQLSQVEREYNALQQQYQQNQTQIRSNSPRYAALRQPASLSAKKIQSLLDDDTLLLNYSLGKDHSYLWLVGRNGVTSHELPNAKEISTLVRRYYSLLTDAKALEFKKAELEQVGQQLSKMLLGPVANQLGQKRLVVVADGALFYLPFAALPVLNGQQPLLTQHEIVHLPSATTLALLRRDNNRAAAPKTLALLADPVFGKDDPRLRGKPTNVIAPQPLNRNRFVGNGNLQLSRLPFTQTEAQNIGRLVPPNQQQTWLGFAANLTNVTAPQLNDYRIVHFATHGVLDSQNPQRSGLILSRLTPNGTYQNGDLTLQEIFNLKLQAELVVLSACQTGMGQSIDNVQDIQGEGLVGLTRGFMYAGTPRVMVSLWNVNDESTAALMSQFYQNKLAKGMTPAAALRQAQLEMLRNPKYQAPFYWAPFILQGEWR